MSEKDDGGTALPIQPIRMPNDEMDWGSSGMSLRDYFAAAALKGLLGDPDFDPVTVFKESKDQATARRCYAYADAMLEERKK